MNDLSHLLSISDIFPEIKPKNGLSAVLIDFLQFLVDNDPDVYNITIPEERNPESKFGYLGLLRFALHDPSSSVMLFYIDDEDFDLRSRNLQITTKPDMRVLMAFRGKSKDGIISGIRKKWDEWKLIHLVHEE